jgi:hypothetical protein
MKSDSRRSLHLTAKEVRELWEVPDEQRKLISGDPRLGSWAIKTEIGYLEPRRSIQGSER